jgi:hypothetical protein
MVRSEEDHVTEASCCPFWSAAVKRWNVVLNADVRLAGLMVIAVGGAMAGK